MDDYLIEGINKFIQKAVHARNRPSQTASFLVTNANGRDLEKWLHKNVQIPEASEIDGITVNLRCTKLQDDVYEVVCIVLCKCEPKLG